MLADLLTIIVLGVTVTISAAMYFLPVLVGAFRRAPDLGSVAVLNVLLGWTLIGWVVALALAFRSTRPQGQVLQLVPNLPTAPSAVRHPPALPPASEPPSAGWAGPPGPPPPRPDGPPPLFLPPDFPERAGCYGPWGEA